MKHLHKATGFEFECGELMETSLEAATEGIRRTYDMTVITFWQTPDGLSPVIIGYYFGEYNQQTTDEYIDRWFKNFDDCRKVIAAYYCTNEDVLEEPWLGSALNALNSINEVAHRVHLD